MAAWTLIPCLVALRAEFNAVAPGRQRGADGAIGDSSHTSSSDHTPDEDSDVLRDHDADSKNEVHALDIDSDGPWPDGSGREAGGWFDRQVKAIAAREREEYLSADVYGRLQNIIWRGRIISRSWGWSEWRARSQNDHYDHAHFSARYLSRTEADTRPWGVEDDVALTDDDKKWLAAQIDKAATSAAERVWKTKWNINFEPGSTPYVAEAGSILAHIPGEHARTEKAIAGVAEAVDELPATGGTITGALTVTGGQITVTTGANE
jgi:hypothetical protein